MDLRSSALKSISENFLRAKHLHFQVRRGAAAFTQRLASGDGGSPNKMWGRVQAALQTARDRKESDVGQT